MQPTCNMDDEVTDNHLFLSLFNSPGKLVGSTRYRDRRPTDPFFYPTTVSKLGLTSFRGIWDVKISGDFFPVWWFCEVL